MRRTVAAACALLALTLTGCGVVDRPDPAGWDQQAGTALEDAASQVATARLALRSAARERTWSTYTTVLVAEAEEAAASTEEDLSRVQVPRPRRSAAARVQELLSRAVDAVAQAREHAVDGVYDDAALLDELDRVDAALEHEHDRVAP